MSEQSPNGPWLPRTDAGARKLIERIDKVSDEVRGLTVEVLGVSAESVHFVTYAKMYLTIGTAAAIVVGSAWYVSRQNIEEGAQQISAFKAQHAEELKAIHTNSLRLEGKIDRVLERMAGRQRRSTISAGGGGGSP